MLQESIFENFNKSEDLIGQIYENRLRKEHWPSSVQADQIYRKRKYLELCRQDGIRLIVSHLGSPPKDEASKKELQAQAKHDFGERNSVEGVFGQAKRRFSLSLVLTRLPHTSKTTIFLVFLVITLKKVLALGLVAFYFLFLLLLRKFMRRKIFYESRSSISSTVFQFCFIG